MDRQRGVGLLELMVTLLVFSIGLISLFKFMRQYSYYYDVNQQRAEALVIAKNKIEGLRGFEVIATTTGKVAYNDIVTGSATMAGNNASYTSTWTVTINTNPDYKTINEVVSWLDRRGGSQSLTLSTIIAKIDPATSGLVYN